MVFKSHLSLKTKKVRQGDLNNNAGNVELIRLDNNTRKSNKQRIVAEYTIDMLKRLMS